MILNFVKGLTSKRDQDHMQQELMSDHKGTPQTAMYISPILCWIIVVFSAPKTHL